MTLAEINRKLKSQQRVRKANSQEQALHNYILAGLMGRSVASFFAEELEMPKLEEVYPSLFTEQAEDTQQKKEELKTELSVLRFKQFAESFNKSFKQ